MRAVVKFAGFVVFQPIINGIGGNLVAVQASKISTMLYQSSVPGILPAFGKIFELPWRVLFYGTPYSMNSLVLILISIPGQVIFIFVADFLHQSTVTIGAPFVFSYMTASLLQIFLLFYIGHVMIHAMWRFKIDPDSAAIPFLTALADLFGSMLLLGAFAFLRAVGREYQGRPIPEVDDGEWWNFQAHHFYSY